MGCDNSRIQQDAMQFKPVGGLQVSLVKGWLMRYVGCRAGVGGVTSRGKDIDKVGQYNVRDGCKNLEYLPVQRNSNPEWLTCDFVTGFGCKTILPLAKAVDELGLGELPC